ncbi:MAG: phospholipase D-like domain-containing protein [Candidatus Thermoplasmatota archaeon]
MKINFKITKITIFLILTFLILLFNLSAISISNENNSSFNHILINEVMYNPKNNDNYYEWLELYNPTSKKINITGWKIKDNYGKDKIELNKKYGSNNLVINPKKYAIITDKGTKIYQKYDLPNETKKLCTDDKSIGNGLGNKQDKLILLDEKNNVIDSLEWGKDYKDIPGKPIKKFIEGNSLARRKETDQNNTIKDFYLSKKPTPGKINKKKSFVEIRIEKYPRFIPKVEKNKKYSVPFAVKIKFTDFEKNSTLKFKVFISKNESSTWPCSQTWIKNKGWKYSYYFTNMTNKKDKDSFLKIFYLRLSKGYNHYIKNIENSSSAYIFVKIKKENYIYKDATKVALLDLDNSTKNATSGGFIIGEAKINKTVYGNETILLTKNNVTKAIYRTENNQIDEGHISKNGYYKLPAPVGDNYTLRIFTKQKEIIKDKLSVKQGRYNFKVKKTPEIIFLRKNQKKSILISIKNTGDFEDTIKIDLKQKNRQLQLDLNKRKINLEPNKEKNISLEIKNYGRVISKENELTINISSTNDINIIKTRRMAIRARGPDLDFKKIKILDSKNKAKKLFGQGEKIKIKAFLKNRGNEKSSKVNVRFYLIEKYSKRIIGTEYYEHIGKYQKYPTIEIFTSNIEPGEYKVFITVNSTENKFELNPLNNDIREYIKIFDTSPNGKERQLLITEIYYHSRPNLKNEFIKIYNPTKKRIDISKWYITDDPFSPFFKQNKIIFPDKTYISPHATLVVTQNAYYYNFETGYFPDFEYLEDSMENISQMITGNDFYLNNIGDFVSLKNDFNHTIDLVVYGNKKNYNSSEWNGKTISLSGEGIILKRKEDNDEKSYIDQDQASDWRNPRLYKIGQSRFNPSKFTLNSNITTFVSPDCSYDVLINQIRKANSSIYINMYEFESIFILDEIIGALSRNVSVKILLEVSPVGGISEKQKYVLSKIRDHGGKIRALRSVKDRKIYKRYTFNHGKYIIIDNETLIIGSCNFVEEGYPFEPTYGNREWGICIENKVISNYFKKVFLDDWNPKRHDSRDVDTIKVNPYRIDTKKQKISGSYKPKQKSKYFEKNISITPVFSPDNSLISILNMIKNAEESIYIEQLYIYKNWTDGKINPLLKELVSKSKQGIDIRIIINYNSNYEDSIKKCKQTKGYLEEKNIKVKFIGTKNTPFINIHNKGVIVDNKSVFIGSINWNSNSFLKNRETGVIIKDKEITSYFKSTFKYDWNIKTSNVKNNYKEKGKKLLIFSNKNTIYITSIYLLTVLIIVRDWRKRKWN